jgi:hypothetical protein
MRKKVIFDDYCTDYEQFNQPVHHTTSLLRLKKALTTFAGQGLKYNLVASILFYDDMGAPISQSFFNLSGSLIGKNTPNIDLLNAESLVYHIKDYIKRTQKS